MSVVRKTFFAAANTVSSGRGSSPYDRNPDYGPTERDIKGLLETNVNYFERVGTLPSGKKSGQKGKETACKSSIMLLKGLRDLLDPTLRRNKQADNKDETPAPNLVPGSSAPKLRHS